MTVPTFRHYVSSTPSRQPTKDILKAKLKPRHQPTATDDHDATAAKHQTTDHLRSAHIAVIFSAPPVSHDTDRASAPTPSTTAAIHHPDCPTACHHRPRYQDHPPPKCSVSTTAVDKNTKRGGHGGIANVELSRPTQLYDGAPGMRGFFAHRSCRQFQQDQTSSSGSPTLAHVGSSELAEATPS